MGAKYRDLYYLATPYSGTKLERHWRYIAACEITWALVLESVLVFSPIVHNHPLDLIGATAKVKLPKKFWERNDLHYMKVCAAGIAVAHLPGWQRSEGVTDEIKWFTDRGLPTLNLNESWLKRHLNSKTHWMLSELEKPQQVKQENK